jgi:hypothetical protein
MDEKEYSDEKHIDFEDIQNNIEVLLEIVVVQSGVGVQKEIAKKFKNETHSSQRFVAVRYEPINTKLCDPCFNQKSHILLKGLCEAILKCYPNLKPEDFEKKAIVRRIVTPYIHKHWATTKSIFEAITTGTSTSKDIHLELNQDQKNQRSTYTSTCYNRLHEYCFRRDVSIIL